MKGCGAGSHTKKGGFSQCDNWRGISLLDMVGKVFASILQCRLQEIVEELVPDSQCVPQRKGMC